MDYGAFVAVYGVRGGRDGPREGLLHVSQIMDEGRLNNVSDALSLGQDVKVKVQSLQGHRISLSMKGINQVRPLRPCRPNHSISCALTTRTQVVS